MRPKETSDHSRRALRVVISKRRLGPPLGLTGWWGRQLKVALMPSPMLMDAVGKLLVHAAFCHGLVVQRQGLCVRILLAGMVAGVRSTPHHGGELLSPKFVVS
jgi:hypothetical protein